MKLMFLKNDRDQPICFESPKTGAVPPLVIIEDLFSTCYSLHDVYYQSPKSQFFPALC